MLRADRQRDSAAWAVGAREWQLIGAMSDKSRSPIASSRVGCKVDLPDPDRLEAGAIVEPGLFCTSLKTTERRSVAWKAICAAVRARVPKGLHDCPSKSLILQSAAEPFFAVPNRFLQYGCVCTAHAPREGFRERSVLEGKSLQPRSGEACGECLRVFLSSLSAMVPRRFRAGHPSAVQRQPS
jgi:hypothetical protein